MGTGTRTPNPASWTAASLRKTIALSSTICSLELSSSVCSDTSRNVRPVRNTMQLCGGLSCFRNLPRIEPSSDFSERLNVRLREMKAAEAVPGFHHSKKFAMGVAVASAIMLGYIGSSLRNVDSRHDIVFPPVVANLPESELAPIVTPAPALVTSVPAGLPIWTAALYAELTPIHFASTDLRLISSR